MHSGFVRFRDHWVAMINWVSLGLGLKFCVCTSVAGLGIQLQIKVVGDV